MRNVPFTTEPSRYRTNRRSQSVDRLATRNPNEVGVVAARREDRAGQEMDSLPRSFALHPSAIESVGQLDPQHETAFRRNDPSALRKCPEHVLARGVHRLQKRGTQVLQVFVEGP